MIGVLALQGAFAEHEHILEELGVPYRQLRQKTDLDTIYDGFILPGGESTVQSKLLVDLGMFGPLKEQIEKGAAVLATCAGMILLAQEVEDDPLKTLAAIPMKVRRNAYGRQLGSFYTEGEVKGIGRVPMTFIRAPYVTEVSPEAETVSVVNGNIVGVKYKRRLAFSFHPELDGDLRIHKKFLDLL